ncbi:HD domain-containing protein [Litchfieldella qijiaojingensis]|uniref:HD domain-containing protein n=1 Tax=Litchfieldella qijiaojingensis TaxID=980347 RepID=UPI0016740BEA|nr:HD domain-containing protein [Halomonas qijiaojingensis]
MSTVDKMRLVAGLVWGQTVTALSLAAKRLGVDRRRMSQLNLDAVIAPDSAATRMADELAGRYYSQPLRLHCLRTYYFGSLWSQYYGLRVDAEVLYVASLLHDLGLSPDFSEQSSCCGFGIVGARKAKQAVAALQWPDERQRAVYEAISYHLNPYLSLAKHEPEAVCLQRAAHLDVVGAGRHLLQTDIIASVHQRYPRDDFREEILATMTGMSHAPSSRATVLGKLGFSKLAASNPLDDPAYSKVNTVKRTCTY